MQLIKNSIWNLLGYILPAIATIISFGVIGRTLGLELFGIFSLILAVIGYSSIFDLGLTRSVIREIAIYKNNHEEKKHIISSSSSIVLI
ncbi:oligosaccharide flippase family protein, partial [Morganella morganii subsp. sibonii]